MGGEGREGGEEIGKGRGGKRNLFHHLSPTGPRKGGRIFLWGPKMLLPFCFDWNFEAPQIKADASFVIRWFPSSCTLVAAVRPRSCLEFSSRPSAAKVPHVPSSSLLPSLLLPSLLPNFLFSSLDPSSSEKERETQLDSLPLSLSLSHICLLLLLLLLLLLICILNQSG